MYTKQELSDMFFFDVETIPQEKDYNTFIEKNPLLKEELDKRITKLGDKEPNLTLEELYSKACSLSPEFGKILCISAGVINFEEDGNYNIKLHSFSSHNEIEVLEKFKKVIEAYVIKKPNTHLTGFNIQSFDIPWICKRMLINRIVIPSTFQVHNKKPWEVKLHDLMKLYQFGSNEYCTLDLVTKVMGLESPKEIGEINSKNLSKYYYENKENISNIVKYCEQDVEQTIKAFLKFSYII